MDVHIQLNSNPAKSKCQSLIGFGFGPIHSQEYKLGGNEEEEVYGEVDRIISSHSVKNPVFAKDG